MRCILIFVVQSLLVFDVCFGQQSSPGNSEYDLYLQKIANVEALIQLKKYKDARSLFESVENHRGKIEYDYLYAKLNQHEKSVKINEGSLSSLAISKRGDLLALGGSDSIIHLRTPNDLAPVGMLKGHKGAITCLDFGLNDKWLISGSRDKSVIVWDVSKREVLKHLKEDSWQGIYDVKLNPDGTQLGVTTWTFHKGKVLGIVHLFDTQSWELITKLEPPSPHPVSAIDFSDDGEGVVYGTWGLVIHYYDFVQRNIKWTLNMMENHEYSSVTSLDISPNNNVVLVGTKDTKVRLVDSKSGNVLFEPNPYQWHNDEVNDVTFNPAGNYFASSSIDESIHMGDVSTGQRTSTLLGHQASVSSIAYHPDGDKLYSVSTDGYLNGWNLNSKQLEIFNGCPDPGYGRGLFYATVEPNGKRLAMACGPQIMIWDLQRQTKQVLDVATYYGIDFSATDQMIVGERDGKLSVWEISTQRMLKRFQAHDDYVQKVISLENSRVLSSSGKILKLWDVKNEKAIKSFDATGFINSFAISQKNNCAVLSQSDGSHVILDLKSLELKKQWKESTPGVVVVISPDERKFAIGYSDGKIKVFDFKSHQQLSEFKDTDGSIASLSFDQTGHSLVSSTSMRTQTVKFWDLSTNACTLSLHEFADIFNIQLLGRERKFSLADKHGRVFLIRY